MMNTRGKNLNQLPIALILKIASYLKEEDQFSLLQNSEAIKAKYPGLKKNEYKVKTLRSFINCKKKYDYDYILFKEGSRSMNITDQPPKELLKLTFYIILVLALAPPYFNPICLSASLSVFGIYAYTHFKHENEISNLQELQSKLPPGLRSYT